MLLAISFANEILAVEPLMDKDYLIRTLENDGVDPSDYIIFKVKSKEVSKK